MDLQGWASQPGRFSWKTSGSRTVQPGVDRHRGLHRSKAVCFGDKLVAEVHSIKEIEQVCKSRDCKTFGKLEILLKPQIGLKVWVASQGIGPDSDRYANVT